MIKRLGFWEIEDPIGGPYNTLFVRKDKGLQTRAELAFTICSASAWLSRKWRRLMNLLRKGATRAQAPRYSQFRLPIGLWKRASISKL